MVEEYNQHPGRRLNHKVGGIVGVVIMISRSVL